MATDICDRFGERIRELRKNRGWRQLDLAEQAGAPDPKALGRQLHLLYDGAALAARMDRRDPAIARTARTAAETLLNAAS